MLSLRCCKILDVDQSTSLLRRRKLDIGNCSCRSSAAMSVDDNIVTLLCGECLSGHLGDIVVQPDCSGTTQCGGVERVRPQT